MVWSDIREAYPNQWLVVEALEAHTTPSSQRQLDSIAVIEKCSSGKEVMQKYHYLHRQYPIREFYFVHTSRADLDIRERQWLGIRPGNAVNADSEYWTPGPIVNSPAT